MSGLSYSTPISPPNNTGSISIKCLTKNFTILTGRLLVEPTKHKVHINNGGWPSSFQASWAQTSENTSARRLLILRVPAANIHVKTPVMSPYVTEKVPQRSGERVWITLMRVSRRWILCRKSSLLYYQDFGHGTFNDLPQPSPHPTNTFTAPS